MYIHTYAYNFTYKGPPQSVRQRRRLQRRSDDGAALVGLPCSWVLNMDRGALLAPAFQ